MNLVLQQDIKMGPSGDIRSGKEKGPQFSILVAETVSYLKAHRAKECLGYGCGKEYGEGSWLH